MKEKIVPVKVVLTESKESVWTSMSVMLIQWITVNIFAQIPREVLNVPVKLVIIHIYYFLKIVQASGFFDGSFKKIEIVP